MGEVSDYLAGLDEPARGILTGIVDRARELVPDAEEGSSYGMAALRYRGRPLFAAVETKDHLSVFPFSPAVVEAVAPELEGYSLSKGTIRFASTSRFRPGSSTGWSNCAGRRSTPRSIDNLAG